ncbi:MAG: hypothetical protein A3K16_06605 [Omnitrophica bacterium RIFCSPLOWO2_01_FULL_45_24]|nr:MAG: hypothetical protein A3G36_05125 [Omnitrophica bacterium RIFCSPLOWO2_12_FULL_45_13]OGW94498.1 MAG: hypothetical protein A3K16_06605 [Omnitrophica bacterium RIFCSPLOWO2_01_FULL_45_24]
MKEVKFLSEFFQNKLVCLNTNLCQRKAGHKSKRLIVEMLNNVANKCCDKCYDISLPIKVF